MATLEIRLENRVKNKSDGTKTYQLRAAVVRRVGDIDSDIFVIEMGESVASDKFNRVANLTDLSSIQGARIDAQTKGDSYFRVSAIDIDYDNADLALSGKTAVQDAVNVLVRDYNEFVGLGSPSSITQVVLTGADQTYLESLKASYIEIQEEIVILEGEEITLQTSISGLKNSLDAQKTRIETLQAARTTLFSTINTVYGLHVSQYTNILGFSALTPGETATVTGYQSAATTYQTNLPSAFAGLDALWYSETRLLNTIYTDIEAQISEQAQLGAKIEEKRRQLDRTLFSILQLEPTFAGV